MPAARAARVRNPIAVALLVAASSFPSLASAQLDPRPPPVAAPAPGVSSPPEPPAPPEREDVARVRFGFDLGPFVSSTHLHTNEAVWWGGRLDVRLGAQLTDLFGVYAQAGALLGGTGFDILGWGTTSTRGMVLGSAAVLAELTLADRYRIALGPSGWVGEHSNGGGVAGAGLAHRVELAWGGKGTGTRQGFSVAVQLDLAWFPTADEKPGGHHYGLSITAGWDTF